MRRERIEKQAKRRHYSGDRMELENKLDESRAFRKQINQICDEPPPDVSEKEQKERKKRLIVILNEYKPRLFPHSKGLQALQPKESYTQEDIEMMKGINEMTKQNLLRAQRERESKDLKEREEYRRTLIDNEQKVINWEEMSYDARQEFIRAASEGGSVPSPSTPPKLKLDPHDRNTVMAREIALMSSANFAKEEPKERPRITVKHLSQDLIDGEDVISEREKAYLASQRLDG